MFWGYSLAYSRTGGPFIGDLSNFGLKNVMAAPAGGSAVIPEIVFCLYQLLFVSTSSPEGTQVTHGANGMYSAPVRCRL